MAALSMPCIARKFTAAAARRAARHAVAGRPCSGPNPRD